MTRVLLAFDKFKDSLTAQQACETAAAALRGVRPDWVVTQAPLADGGEGFAEILARAAEGTLIRESVSGPRGDPVVAEYGLVPVKAIPASARLQLQLPAMASPEDRVAVIEMARASGLALLPGELRNPWQTTSRGTGELMRSGLRRGVVAILLGVGGSATHDLGLGALTQLGYEFHTRSGETVDPPMPVRWEGIARVSGGALLAMPPTFIACDVTNPLLGARGAAAVYGPQKGLRPEDHPALEQQSERLARMLCRHAGKPEEMMSVPGAGAAGGIAFGLMVGVGAKLLPGFDLVSAWLDLEAKLAEADLVITGEGRFDESSLEGKGPGAVAARALQLGKSVHVFAGQVTAANRPRLELHAITPAHTPLAQALREAQANLGATVRRVFSNSHFS